MGFKQLMFWVFVIIIGAIALKDSFSAGDKFADKPLEMEANTLIGNAKELTEMSKFYRAENREFPADAQTLVTEGYIDRIKDDLVLSVTAPYVGSAESIGHVSPEVCLMIHNMGTGSNDTSLVPDGDLDLTAPYDCIEDGAGESVLVYF